MSPADLLHWQYGPASVPELAWTTIGVLGFAFTYRLVRECNADMAALLRSPVYVAGGALHIMARQNLRTMVQRLTLFAAFVAVGLVLCFTPSPTQTPSPASIVLAFVFVFSEITMALCSYQDGRDRIELHQQGRRLRRADIAATMAKVPPVVVREEGDGSP